MCRFLLLLFVSLNLNVWSKEIYKFIPFLNFRFKIFYCCAGVTLWHLPKFFTIYQIHKSWIHLIHHANDANYYVLRIILYNCLASVTTTLWCIIHGMLTSRITVRLNREKFSISYVITETGSWAKYINLFCHCYGSGKST
jgi:hypothetical protein